VGETGGSEAEDRARGKVAEAIRRAKAGEDFAKLAREMSEDTASKPNGGELGWVKKGEMVPPFDQALSTLRKGEITPEPVRTAFGYHAIRALDVREAGRRSLKEVAPSLRERLAGEAADRAARARADEVRPPLQAASDFAAEAKRLQLTPLETTIARSERGSALAGPDSLEEAAFTLAIGGVSPPVKTPAGWVILKARESIPAGVPPLAEIKDGVTTAVKRRKADATALERAKQLSADGRAGDFTAAARKAGAIAGETPRFSRAKPAERLPGDAMLAALETPVGTVTDPVKTPQGYYVLKVVERVPPNLDDLTRERDTLTRELLAAKQTQAWETWISQARAAAKIEVGSRVQPMRRSRS
jgi:peptidyl-prolyl cis-trans isomerase D